MAWLGTSHWQRCCWFRSSPSGNSCGTGLAGPDPGLPQMQRPIIDVMSRRLWGGSLLAKGFVQGFGWLAAPRTRGVFNSRRFQTLHLPL